MNYLPNRQKIEYSISQAKRKWSVYKILQGWLNSTFSSNDFRSLASCSAFIPSRARSLFIEKK